MRKHDPYCLQALQLQIIINEFLEHKIQDWKHEAEGKVTDWTPSGKRFC